MAHDQAELYVLLDRISQGDEAALGKLYDVTVNRIFGMALRVTTNHSLAEEVVTDVFMQVWRTARTYSPDMASPLGWLLMMTRSRAIDSLRREGHLPQQQVPLDEQFDLQDESVGSNPEDTFSDNEQSRALHEAMQLLNERERQMIALAFYRGMSHGEIAQATGQPLGTIKSILRKAQAVLRAALEQPDPDKGGYYVQ